MSLFWAWGQRRTWIVQHWKWNFKNLTNSFGQISTGTDAWLYFFIVNVALGGTWKLRTDYDCNFTGDLSELSRSGASHRLRYSINNRIKQAIQRFINKKKPTTKKITKTTVTTDCTPAAQETATPCVNTVTSQVTATTPCENPVTITATCDNPVNVISVSETVCHERSPERQPRRVRSKRSNSCNHHRILRSSSRRSKRIRRNRVCNCSAIWQNHVCTYELLAWC